MNDTSKTHNNAGSTAQCRAKGCSQGRLLFESYCQTHLAAENSNVPLETYEKAFGDTSNTELDAQLDEILTALEPQHKTMNKRRAKQALLALIAQREQAAELRGREVFAGELESKKVLIYHKLYVPIDAITAHRQDSKEKEDE